MFVVKNFFLGAIKMKVNKNVLAMIRGKIAMKGILKKSLAQKCGVSNSQFSELIWGDRPMPEHILRRLLHELDLAHTVKKLGLVEASTLNIEELL